MTDSIQERLSNLPTELLFQVTSWLEVTDVLSLSAALARPSLLDIFTMDHLWRSTVIGPRIVEKSSRYLGPSTQQLKVVGSVEFDRNHKPKKERFFKSRELLPRSVISRITQNCPSLVRLTLDKCVIGPHIKTTLLPPQLEVLTVRSTVFVKKTSFFRDIWTNLPRLRELRVENIQNFNKDDCYAILVNLKIDFDVKYVERSPSFIFYRN